MGFMKNVASCVQEQVRARQKYGIFSMT